jgi:hypothetical protein
MAFSRTWHWELQPTPLCRYLYFCYIHWKANYNNVPNQHSYTGLHPKVRPVAIPLTEEFDCLVCDRPNIPEHRPRCILGRLGPGTDDAHAESTQKYQDACINPPLPTENAPALVTEKVLRHQLHKRGKNQKSSWYGIHDTDNEQTNLRVGTIECMGCETNSLPDWGSRSY